MKNFRTLSLFLFSIFLVSSLVLAQDKGYVVGDTAMGFDLQTVDGSQVSLDGLENNKGAIVIFSCNTCPYVQAYEDRMIDLHQRYAPKGYPVIAINSNDEQVSPGDSFDAMQQRAQEKDFPFAYAYDKSQEVIKTYGATRTPQVYLLEKQDDQYLVRYIGAIDNNYQDAASVSEPYLANAVDALLEGKEVTRKTSKAIGCSIKWSR
ncbi:thioredoxin family protein [Cyclobacterium jeungdonense]|uniref:Thioredoxin family protein n=1 Tax=Cyclobacterium jeungdonense TaxID=708087 RepID=A0ABT8C5T1_9BACT|nr:thioredoxin family protein [Cyclobacterium jeungdonense]MDN3688091.1 thioredoxin family protein [Cyclobacterium jeungdonense]